MRLTSAGVVLLFFIVLCSTISPAFAQPKIHQTTTPPSDARFEIVQSPLAAKWTFRLDRYTGRVYQLVKTQGDGVAWETMLFLGGPEASKPMRPKFVIFSSGLAARHTFLMDSDTGQTWILTNILGVPGWQPFKE